MKSLWQSRGANLVSAFIFLAVALVTFAQMSVIGENRDGSDPGAAGYPNLIGGTMVVLAVLLAFQRDKKEAAPTRREFVNVLAAVAATVGYIWAMQPLGYVLSTVLFLVVTMLIMGIRSVVALIAMPVALALVNFYLFYVAFGIPLPYAFIEGILV